MRCGAGARCLASARWRSTCTKLVREARASVIRLRVSIAGFVWVVSIMRHADEEKKEVLNRVLLIRWIVAESLQSTCQDVGRRGHHWLYHRLRRRCRPQ